MVYSLFRHYPLHLYVPLLVLASGTLNVLALCVPFVVIRKFVFFQDAYTLPHSVRLMWAEGHVLLASLIFAFSIVFPFFKLGALTVLWFLPFDAARRQRCLHLIGVLGKWSMLDVFIIAVLLVLTESKQLVSAEPRIGVYLFAAAILLSMVVTLTVDSLAKSVDRRS